MSGEGLGPGIAVALPKIDVAASIPTGGFGKMDLQPLPVPAVPNIDVAAAVPKIEGTDVAPPVEINLPFAPDAGGIDALETQAAGDLAAKLEPAVGPNAAPDAAHAGIQDVASLGTEGSTISQADYAKLVQGMRPDAAHAGIQEVAGIPTAESIGGAVGAPAAETSAAPAPGGAELKNKTDVRVAAEANMAAQGTPDAATAAATPASLGAETPAVKAARARGRRQKLGTAPQAGAPIENPATPTAPEVPQAAAPTPEAAATAPPTPEASTTPTPAEQTTQQPTAEAKAQQQRAQALEAKIKDKTATPDEIRELRDLKQDPEQQRQILEQKALDGTITDDEADKLGALNSKDTTHAAELTPEQQTEQLNAQIDQLGTELMTKLGKGQEVTEKDAQKLQELMGQKDLQKEGFTPDQIRGIMKTVRRRGSETHSMVAKELQAKVQELMALELTLLSIPKNQDALREQRREVQGQADARHKEANRLQGDERLRVKGQEYALYMQIANINASIIRQKYEADVIDAERRDLEQYVRRKAGVTGGGRAVLEFAGAKINNVSTAVSVNCKEAIDYSWNVQ